MFCKKCGKELKSGTKFCTSCGSPVVENSNTGNDSMNTVYNSNPTPQVGTLNYEIIGGNFPAVSIRLNQNESIYTQSGGMTWMDTNITMETNMKGGLMKGLGRMFSGESLFMATYTSNAPNQEIVIASTFPGHIVDIDVGRCPIIAQKVYFYVHNQL